MRLGRVDDALATFREVLRLCGELPNTPSVGSTYVLALWDVAVALDRSGDPRGALETAAKASRVDLGGRTGRVPHREGPRRLLRARLGAPLVPGARRGGGGARRAGRARRGGALGRRGARARRVRRARRGRGGHDPWIAIAKVRLERARAERAERRQARGQAPAAPADAGGPEWIGD